MIPALKILKKDEIQHYEPHAIGEAAIYCPETGIVDYSVICEMLERKIKEKGEIRTEFNVKKIQQKNKHLIISSNYSDIKTHFLINCAGLFSDRISSLAGFTQDCRVVPFRGEYYMVNKEGEKLVNNLIYPVPDSRYPFLGVHFTRTINGEIEVGPNAVLAFAREGYEKLDINIKDMWDYLSFPGFWKMAARYWDTGLEEYCRSIFKSYFYSLSLTYSFIVLKV